MHMANHNVEPLTLEQAIKEMSKLQEKLFELDPKHRLVSYREFTDEEQSNICRVNLISSFCSNNTRPLVNQNDLQEAANGYLEALKIRLKELDYVESVVLENPDTNIPV